MAAFLHGAFEVYISIKEQKRQAEQELDGMKSLITQNSSEFFTEPFREQIRKRLADCTALQGIIITGSLGSLGFEKENGGLINLDQTPRFNSRFGYAPLQAKPVDIPGFRNVNIHAVFNTLDYDNVIRVLKLTLTAILGALILSFFTMIITILRSRGRSLPSSGLGADSFIPSPSYAPNLDDDFGGFDEPEAEGEPYSLNMEQLLFDQPALQETDTEPEAEGEPYSLNMEQLLFDQPALQETDTEPEAEGEPYSLNMEQLLFDQPALQETDTEPETPDEDDFHLDDFLDEDDLSLPESTPVESSGSKPSGLYSPRSNIGWESYTQDRLASELHRCAASEQDLVVLLMECGEGVNCDGRLYKKIADEAVELFNLKDLSFEYGDRGITVIIPNAGLEQGITKVEEFHARILKTCSGSFHSKNDFLTGISSRSGRLIEADRLFMEASRALEKAKLEPGSPIVAFKSDPEKYRDFVRKGTSLD
ncbi:MAG: hypothetical protein FWG27_04315 [Treponema sp.]|nr:hypothetical protein [Treponema sp.]